MVTIEQFLIEGQGFYSGYFQYEGKRVVESFSIMLRRALPGESNRSSLEVVGYGQNGEIGSFTLQGKIELIGQHKLKERQMPSPQLKRLKIARFQLEKVYIYKDLKTMTAEKANTTPQK